MFEYNGVLIRPIEKPDLPVMVRLRADPAIWENLGNIEMVGERQQELWHERVLANPTVRYYVLCSKEIQFIGIVRMDELDFINHSVRVGGDILPEYQGQGYGTRLFALLKKYGFDYLNLNRLWLLVLETNERALKLYRKSGFKEEGRQRQGIYRNGRYLDYIMMSILRSEYLSEVGQTRTV